MTLPSGYLESHPLPNGIAAALGIGGYQLLADVAGVGAGRLGSHAFLLVAPDEQPGVPDPGTQIALHQPRLRDEGELASFTQLAAQIGFLRLSGYKVVLEREGMRSHLGLMNPANGSIAIRIPAKYPGRLFGSSSDSAPRLLATTRGLPPAGPPPDTQNPELMHQVVLALALGDPDTPAHEAVDLADKAVELAKVNPQLAPPAALEAARQAE